MRASSSRIACIAASVLLKAPTLWSHPLCYYDNRPPDTSISLTFCPAQDEYGSCCTLAEESAVETTFNAAGSLSTDCSSLYTEVVCGVCNSYSQHLFERLGADYGEEGLTMTVDFCDSLVTACADYMDFADDYCELHTGGEDQYWSYPLSSDVTDTFSTTGLVDAFPNLADGSLPSQAISMRMTPDGSSWWICGQDGQIVSLSSDDPTTSTTVMDISTGKNLLSDYEEGLLDFAFNPLFTSNNLFYISYTVEDGEDRLNRLSKYIYSAGSATATANSEEILITTIPKSDAIHSAGWVGFQPSDYSKNLDTYDLYWSIGDGGPQDDTDMRAQDTSNLLGTIVRISVPSSASETGYTIPSGNIGDAGAMPEICAYGFRNPYRCGFDMETDVLYCGDVGQSSVESIDIVTCGYNYGWRRFEGSRCLDTAEDEYGSCAGADRSGYTFPIFEYCHPDYESNSGDSDYTDGIDICGDRAVEGSAVVGGSIYRGSRYNDVLMGAYVFADYQEGSIHYIMNDGGSYTVGSILSDGAAMVSFAEDNDGEMYIIADDRNVYNLPCGDLCVTTSLSTTTSSVTGTTTSTTGTSTSTTGTTTSATGTTTSATGTTTSTATSGSTTSTTSGGTCLDQSATVPAYEFVGCYVDAIDTRVLDLAQAAECGDSMSPDICASYCGTVDGAAFFGVEYAYQCFCGSATAAYDSLGDSTGCTTACEGNASETCGGNFAIEVFELTS